MGASDAALGNVFQSTLPVRGATFVHCISPLFFIDFNPRSPCGERPSLRGFSLIYRTYFNPRSPCGERPSVSRYSGLFSIFQSTLPVRGATKKRGNQSCMTRISIHAPRAGSDPL